jgi:hypothetical protein
MSIIEYWIIFHNISTILRTSIDWESIRYANCFFFKIFWIIFLSFNNRQLYGTFVNQMFTWFTVETNNFTFSNFAIFSEMTCLVIKVTTAGSSNANCSFNSLNGYLLGPRAATVDCYLIVENKFQFLMKNKVFNGVLIISIILNIFINVHYIFIFKIVSFSG